MNFSIILNSRGRVEQLDRFISVFENKTKYPQNVEMIITGDNDDIPTVEFLNSLHNRKSFLFHEIIGTRPKSLNASINNMAKIATGRFILVANDDAEIVTPNWDEIALENIKKFQQDIRCKDDILYCCTEDNSVDKVAGKKYSSFPIISSESVRILGFFMYGDFVGLGGDSSIYRVYDEISRVLYLPEIQFDHVYHNAMFKIFSPDQTALEMRRNSHINHVDPFTFDISKDVSKLKRYISERNQDL